MKQKLFFLAAMMTATVMNLQAAKVYLDCESFDADNNWNQAGSKMGAMFTDGTTTQYTDFMSYDNKKKLFYAEIPSGNWTSCVFIRYAFNATQTGWNDFWNRSCEVSYDGSNNLYTLADWDGCTDTRGKGYFSDGEWGNVPTEPDTLNYLHFVSLKEGDSIRFWKDEDTEFLTVDLQYSTDNRKSWVDYQWDYTYGEIIPLTVDSSIWFRAGGDGINPTIAINNNTLRVRFGMDDSIAVAGNIMSLYDATCKQDTMTKSGFRSLFSNLKGLVDASQLLLPASQLASNCYSDMFQGCTNLTSIPSLRATTLAENCYSYMFYGCSKLHVDTISGSCDGAELIVPEMVDQPSYWNYWMFNGCQGAYADNIQPGGHYCIHKYVEPGPGTEVENVNDNDNDNDNVNDNHNCKFMHNGQLYIRRGDAIYDAKGQVVK